MPRNNSWAIHFEKTLDGIALAFPSGVPEIDWSQLRELEDRINELWTSEEGNWEEFKKAVGEYRMFWWGYRDVAENL